MKNKQYTDQMMALIHSRMARCGNIDEAHADLDRWDTEKDEQIRGAYYFTYYAADKADADAFMDDLKNAAVKPGVEVECTVEFGELDAEVKGPFAGRTLVEFFVR